MWIVAVVVVVLVVWFVWFRGGDSNVEPVEETAGAAASVEVEQEL